MTLRLLSALLVTLALSSCASTTAVRGQQNANASQSMHMDSTRDIVLAVRNPVDPPSLHAGSNLLGYSSGQGYGAGQRAVSQLDELKQHYGLREVTGWSIKALDLYCVVLEPPAGVSRDALLASLGNDPRVALAQPLQDYAVYSDAPQAAHRYNDPYAELQRGFVETDAAQAHGISQGDSVRVAVIDTGADVTHPDLKGRVEAGANEVDGNAARFEADRHGTEVAGVIAAIGDNHLGIVGIAPRSRVSVYKACWYAPDAPGIARCNSFTLAKALAAVLDTDARIVNLSLGGPSDPLLKQLLQALLNQRRIVIAALPPDGSLEGFPSGDPGVIVVRTSTATPAPAGVVSAPGKDILTTQPGGGYDFTSGSSMAAAHVSGIAALLLAISPQLDARHIRDLLQQGSKPVNGNNQVDAAGSLSVLRAANMAGR